MGILSLGRKRGEWVQLRLKDGTKIRVGLGEVKGSIARLLFEAPTEVEIVREEILSKPFNALNTRVPGD